MNPDGKSSLSHLDERGRARMVDVSAKPVSERRATASGFVEMSEGTLALVRAGELPKGDVLAAARLAGIMAAKRTHELIPLCHPLPLDRVEVEFELRQNGIAISATAAATARTGVEMEAMTAVAIAALTLYDMCKSVERGISIGPVRLERKSGGSSGIYERKPDD